MLKKLIVVLCLASLFFAPTGALAKPKAPPPTPTPTPEYDFAKMTSYEMFWPVTAGKVAGDKFYTLKIWRDRLVGFLIFSDLRKSEYFKNLANKRLVEAERLVEIQRWPFLEETLEKSEKYLENGLALLYSAKETSFGIWLKEEYRKDLAKHLIVLERMIKKADGEQSQVIQKRVDNVKALVAKYKIEIPQ